MVLVFFSMIFFITNHGNAQSLEYASTKRVIKESNSVLDNRFIWIVYDQIYGQSDLDDALSYQPDMIFRGWFKWGNLGAGFKSKSWMPQQANSKGAYFGGGGTCSALFSDEVSPDVLERIVSRNPNNEPEYFSHTSSSGCYNGDIQNTEYLDFVLRWAYDQIDAGVQSLFLDEPDGGASWYTGYGDNGIEAFRLFLIEKYVQGKGWAPDDSRWNSQFGIDLASDCPDSTINSFNYRHYLQRKNLSDAPYMDNNQLRFEWGDPWTTADTTYLYQRNHYAWQYLTAAIKKYCNVNGKNVSIANIDFLIETQWNTWNVINGRLDISKSYVRHWRDRIDWGIQNLGQKVPLILFLDWGSNMPFFDQIPLEDRILWLRIYAAELFASGGILAWPISSNGNCYRASQEPLLADTIHTLINWYREHQEFYTNTEWVGDSLVDLHGETDLVTTIMEQPDSNRRIVHIINKREDQNYHLVPRTLLQITIPSDLEPKSIEESSPDVGTRNVLFTWRPEKDRIDVTLDSLDAYLVLVIDYSSTNKINDGKKNPDQFSLQQNYPNPFNGGTVVSYSISQRSFVKLKVCDVLGREVEILVNDYKEPGQYNIHFNAGHLSDGIYFIILKAQGFVNVKKCVYIK